MRGIKPLSLGMLTRTFDFGREHRFVLTVLAPFPLREPQALLPEIDLWKLVGKKLGRFAVFDAAMWKPQGEVVVAGSCFPPDGPALTSLAGLTVTSNTGETLVDKTVAVHGDRTWDAAGMSAPTPFTEMPLDYAHAYGGEGFDANPVGRGHGKTRTEDGESIHRLPNIEDPARPIEGRGDRPPPASFGACDPLWPANFKKMGTYDAKWRDELFPGFAEDIDWTVFQTAPPDQRLAGHFSGGETIRMVHMHPDAPVLETTVPTFVGRGFVRMAGQERLEEIEMRAETVYLFPDAEVGCVIHRGVRTIGTRDGSDVEVVLVAAEDREGPRRAQEHYEEAVRVRADPAKAALFLFRDRDFLPESLATAPLRATADDRIEDAVKLEYHAHRRGYRKAERELEATKRQLLAEGASPEQLAAITLPPMDARTPSLDELPDVLERTAAQVAQQDAEAESQKAAMEQAFRDACREEGLDYDAVLAEARRAAAGPPRFSAQRELELMRDQVELARHAGVSLPHVEEQIADPRLAEKLRRAEDELHRAYRLIGHMQPSADRLEGEEADRARAELLAALAAGEPLDRRDFTGASLRGLDLSGKNLRGVYLENADLTSANLAGADLTGAVLARADLTSADLTGATLRDANLGRALLDRTKLDGVSLAGVTLYETELRRTSMVGADLGDAHLLEARFDRVDLSRARAKRLFFFKSQLRGASFVDAELDEVMFVEADVTEANFSRATLRKASFYKTKAARVKLLGATLDNARFVGGCDLDGAELGGARMTLTNFGESSMRGADLTMVEAKQCELSRAILDGANLYRLVAIDSRFAGTSLAHAAIRGASLRYAIFHGAKLGGADFTGSNLFGADFSGAVGDDATSFAECVVERVIMPRRT